MDKEQEKINNAIEEVSPSNYLDTLDRERPYNGQPWTDAGIRGRQEVSGITMRDIRDCYIRACFECSGLSPSEYPKSIFDLDWSSIDPLAVIQNTLCWVERYMGIFPNTSHMSFEETMKQVPIVDLGEDDGFSKGIY